MTAMTREEFAAKFEAASTQKERDAVAAELAAANGVRLPSVGEVIHAYSKVLAEVGFPENAVLYFTALAAQRVKAIMATNDTEPTLNG